MTDVRGCRLWSLDLNSCSVIHLLKRLFRSLPTMFKTYIPISSSMFFFGIDYHLIDAIMTFPTQN